MRALLILFTVFTAFACAKKESSFDEGGGLMLLRDISTLSSCRVHEDCRDERIKCVFAAHDYGTSRQCLHLDSVVQYFGCSSGSLAIHPTNPWTVICVE